MRTPTKITAMGRLDQILLSTRMFDSFKEARKQIKLGNIYVKAIPYNEAASYWVRFTDVEGLVLFTGPTVIRYIDSEGGVHDHAVEPLEGVAID